MMKIEFLIDPANPGHVNAVNAFFNAFNGVAPTGAASTERQPYEKSAKKAKPLNEVLAPKEEQTAPPAEKSESPLTTEAIRTIVAEKVAANIENREKIKAKLTELGAANVASLDASKYLQFNEYLNTL